MKLLELYESILNAAGMVVTEDGCVSSKLGGDVTPVLIKGKRLVLPTQEHLKGNNWTERIVFHPLSENILKKNESEVLETFRKSINTRLNYILGGIGITLLRVAASPKEHHNLSPDQQVFLTDLKDADEKTIEVFQKILQANSADASVVNIFLKKGGVMDGKTWSRLGVVQFPIFEELVKKSDTCFGVKMRVKDKNTIIKLFEYILPNIGKAGSYNHGSDSKVAPFLDALMMSFLGIASATNAVVELFTDHFDDDFLVNHEWVETFENLEVMRTEIRMIPMQAGNDGAEQQPQVTAPLAPAPTPTVFAPAPGYPPPPYGGYPVPPPQAPAIVTTSRGVDFNSVIRSNPVVASTVYQNQMPYQMQQNPVNDVPRFARQGFTNMSPNMGGVQYPMQGNMGNMSNMGNMGNMGNMTNGRGF